MTITETDPATEQSTLQIIEEKFPDPEKELSASRRSMSVEVGPFDAEETAPQPAPRQQRITIKPPGETFADAGDPFDRYADVEEAQAVIANFSNADPQSFSATDTRIDPDNGDEVTYGLVELRSGQVVRVPIQRKPSQQRVSESSPSGGLSSLVPPEVRERFGRTGEVVEDVAKGVLTGFGKGVAETANALTDLFSGPNAGAIDDPISLMYKGFSAIQDSLIEDPQQVSDEILSIVAPDLTEWVQEPFNFEGFGGLVKGIAQFATPAIPAAKIVKAVSSANALARSFGWGAIADYFAFDPMTPTISQELIEAFAAESPEARLAAANAAMAILEKKENQPILNRLKMVPEGILIGGAFEAVMRSPQAARATAGLVQMAARVVQERLTDIGETALQRFSEGKSPFNVGMSIEEVRADTRHGSEIVAERLKVLVPENQRVASGKKYRPGRPDGRPWSELSDDELAAPGPGFKGSDADIERLLQEAIAESSAAGQQAASETGMHVTLSAREWDKALKLPLRAQLWYEISGEAFTRRIPYLARNPDEFITFTDVVGVTSPREKPLGNLSRSLAILSQKIRGVPIDVDLTNTTGVQQALARGEETVPGVARSSVRSGNKTGNFSDTIALTGGVDVPAPIPVNDVWVGRIFGVTEEQLGQYQSLHEPMAIFWNKMRDLVNETAPGQFPHESWQLQARGWVSLRGAQSDYAQAMDTIVDQLRKAGIPGVTPEGVITEEALRHPDFVTALRPTVQAFRDAPKATIEFGQTQTKTGARAATLAATMRGRPDDEKASKLYREYNQILTSAMYRSGRGKRNMWDRAYNHVMGRPPGADVSRIRMGTQERPFDVAGSFEGVFSPNIRIPLREMTDQQVSLFNAIVGKGLRRDAMAASRIKMLAPDAEPAAGTVRGQTVFIKSAGDLSGDEIEAFSRALPEGFDVSTERVANGYVIDINPRFGDDGPVGITDAEINPALQLLADRGLGFRTIYHQHSSVYNEASEYAGILAARKKELRDGAVNELVERVGLTRRQARNFLSGKEPGPGTQSKRQRAGRIRATFTGRLGDLDEAITAARETSKGVETKFKDWISAADKHLAAPSPTPKGPPPDLGATVQPETAPPSAGFFNEQN